MSSDDLETKASVQESELDLKPPVTSLGPIPPPNFLEKYENLVPGTAKRFLEEPLLEAEERRSLERFVAQKQADSNTRAQWMAFVLAIGCITAAFTLIFLRYDVVGLAALLISLAAFVGVFIYARCRKPEP